MQVGVQGRRRNVDGAGQSDGRRCGPNDVGTAGDSGGSGGSSSGSVRTGGRCGRRGAVAARRPRWAAQNGSDGALDGGCCICHG